jgi:serine/threonine protein kinase
MQLSRGDKLGPYEILSLLGAGGMGEVYRARDSRLGREVAIKTTSEEFSGRFQREARAISSLNHPHICTLHDIGPDYLVMELLEGDTLKDRLRKNRLPMDLVFRYGAQIADALAAAHAKGITHRDLKPGNVMVTKAGIKVLDFGLAKVRSTGQPDDRTVEALTATAVDVVMGTPGYMAPEQMEGKECDARSDIFALGVVLYEMAAGKRPFQGESRAALAAEVLKFDPPPLENVSPYFSHIVSRCLAKDPENRWHAARDIQFELEFAGSGVAQTSAPTDAARRSIWPLALSAVAVLAAVAGTVLYFGSTTLDPKLSPLTSYPNSEITPTLSPDGSQVAFAWNGADPANFDIYVKQIGPGEPLRLTKDPADDVMARWSPDGKWIAFLRKQGLDTGGVYVVPALGGLERKLADSVYFREGRGYWGNWFDNLDWSPDGKWLVISKRLAPGQDLTLALLSFESGEIRPLLPPLSFPSYASAVFAPDGHALAFWRASGTSPGAVMVQPLSAGYQTQGPAKEIALGARRSTFIPSISWSADSKDLIYSVGSRETAALWRVAATGSSAARPLSLIGDGADSQTTARKGDRMVFSRYDQEYDIWSLTLDENGRAVGNAVKAFNSTRTEMNPHFSPDGSKVAFASNRSGNDEIWVCLSDGSNCSQLTNYGGPQVGTPRWSPDGNWIAFDLYESGSSIQIISSGGGKPRRLTNGLSPRWSNDGKWIYGWCLPDVGTCRTPSGGGKTEKAIAVTATVETSPDGTSLYYAPGGTLSPPLRRMPVSGGDSIEVLPALVAGQKFAVTTSGVYYMTPNNAEGTTIQFYDFASKSTRIVYRPSRPAYSGFALSPDGRRLLFSQIERSPNHDLVLVESFR